LDLLELSSFGVQFRYEESALNDEPLERKTLLAKIESLFKTVETAISRTD
jgi:hypothetical protein